MKRLLHVLPVLIVAMSILCPLFKAYALPADTAREEKAVDAGREGAAADKGEGGGGEPDAVKPKIFGFEAGYNGSYAEGTSPKSFYSQPYLNIYLKHTYVKFTAGISRFWDYQISNGAGGFETVNFTQPKIALSFYPHEVVELFVSYLYSAGDKSHYYKVHDVTGGLYLDFEVVSLGFSGNYKKSDYKFYSDDNLDSLSIVENISPPLTRTEILTMMARYKSFKKQNTKHLVDYTLSPTFSWYIIESTSLDFGYDYAHSDFKNPYSFTSIYPSQNDNILYYSHTGRIGISSETCRYFTLIAGVTAGWSSDDYIAAGGTIEAIVNLFDYVNLSASYAPVYNIAPPMDPVKRKILEYRSYRSIIRTEFYGKRFNVNPFMRLQDIGKSFWSHGVSFNVSFRY